MDWDRYKNELALALTEKNPLAVTRLVDEFEDDIEQDDERVPDDVCLDIMGKLKNGARFAELKRVGVLVTRHNDNISVQRILAQAKIELGEVVEAISLLKSLLEGLNTLEESEVAVTEKPKKREALEEKPEVQGLLGRAYKKFYCDAMPNKDEQREYDFGMAYSNYLECYNGSPGRSWHAVNLIALLAFRDRRVFGKNYTKNQEIRKLANSVLSLLPDTTEDVWELASRAEALLALGRNREARETLERYLLHEEVSAFHIGSTRRQLKEMWGLTVGSPPGDKIIPMLDSAFAQNGGLFEIERTLSEYSNYEAVLGKISFEPVNWLRDALDRTRAVARIGRKPHKSVTRQANGTGFLFDGSDIHPKLSGKHLLLTNSHVSTSSDEVRQSLPELDSLTIEETRVAFLESGKGGDESIRVVREWFTSPPWKLDATLLELERVPTGVVPLSVSDEDVVKGDAVNIMGHPEGDEMVVAMQDNLVTAVDSPKLFYRTPTKNGSSGSPVFDRSWRLVALHHAGPNYQNSNANAGILIDPIVNAIKAHLDKTDD